MTNNDPILEILRRSLDRGKTVEVDGLGIFQKKPNGEYAFEAQAQPRVFIAYASEDLKLARRLSDAVERAGCSPWLDKDKLLPGQNWPRAIERAIEISDAFVACFSMRSIAKRGQFQSELRYALDCARRFPLDRLFLIPVRFEVCPVPRRISDHVQYVDLFPGWDRGVRRIVRSLQRSV
ncbi:MAG TPA: TIR domain-containing protein, partial [Bryobacteraceae bacterium]|nr:TIR domain-containing protein [Bryobacteraceae bacterium]